MILRGYKMYSTTINSLLNIADGLEGILLLFLDHIRTDLFKIGCTIDHLFKNNQNISQICIKMAVEKCVGHQLLRQNYVNLN